MVNAAMKDSRNKLTIEHLNAQSLLSHIDEVEILMEERNVDILCISETWLDSCIQDSFINLYNYNVYRCGYEFG